MYDKVSEELLDPWYYTVYGYEETDTSTLKLLTYRQGSRNIFMLEYDPLGKLSQKEKEAVWTSKSSTITNGG